MLKSSSFVSANLMRSSFLFLSFKPCRRSLMTATSSVPCTPRSHGRGFMALSSNATRLPSVNRSVGASPDELPSRPREPEIDPTETPPEYTGIPSDPPPPNPGPEIPIPPSPSPPMPDIPNVPVPPPGTPPDVVPPRAPPDWEPPRPPEIVPPPGVPPGSLPPGIDPPKGPFVI